MYSQLRLLCTIYTKETCNFSLHRSVSWSLNYVKITLLWQANRIDLNKAYAHIFPMPNSMRVAVSCHEAWKRVKKGVSITDFAVAIWLPSFIIVNWIKLFITFVDRTSNSEIRREHSISKPSCKDSFSNPSFLNLIYFPIVHNFCRLNLELSASTSQSR